MLKILKKIPLTPEERKIRKQERILLVLSGILLGISFPPMPFPFQLLIFFALVPFLHVVTKKNKLIEINKAAYLMGFVFSLITLYWVGSWQETADPFLMISGVLLVFVNPVFFLIPVTLYYFAVKILNRKFVLFLLPLFWVTYEYLYMLTDLSFPWLTLGNGLSSFNLFIQPAEYIGLFGFTIIIWIINIFLFKAFVNFRENRKTFFINISAAFLFFILILIAGIILKSDFKISDKKIRAGLIQPDIDPWDKWDGELRDLNSFLELYLSLSREAVSKGAQIVIWPETALPVYLLSGQYPGAVDSIYNFVNENRVYLLTGMPDIRYYSEKTAPDDAKYSQSGYYYTTYNAIMLFTPGSREVQRYGKMKLVPFGERVPFVDQLPFLGKIIKWGVGISGWNVGKDSSLFHINYPGNNETVRINGLVCYESIYPAFVARFVSKGADFIAVVTNDSWYGKLSGPYQHKEFSIFRAVENRKTVVRAANGGVSCLINPAGIIEKETEMFTRTFLVAEIPLQDELTFYSRNPLIIPVICCAVSLWVLGLFILKKVKEKFKL